MRNCFSSPPVSSHAREHFTRRLASSTSRTGSPIRTVPARTTLALSASLPPNRPTMSRSTVGSTCRVSGSTVVMWQRPRSESSRTIASPTCSSAPGQSRSLSPSTPPMTMFGRSRRTSRPKASIAPSVATSKGRISKRSRPSHASSQRVGARCLLYEREGVRAVPRMTVDARTAVGIKRSAQTKEAVLPPRCAHPLRASHAHDAVAGNTLASNHRGR